MNRRKFLLQGLTIGVLPLLPNITMSQVRPTIDIELSFLKLSVSITKVTITMQKLGNALRRTTRAFEEIKWTDVSF